MTSVTRLRNLGYAVVVFTPDELRGVEPRRVHDRLVELGNEVIDVLSDQPKPDAEPSMSLYEVFCRPASEVHHSQDQLVLRVLAPGRAHMDEAVDGTKATWYFLEKYHYAITDVDFTLPAEMDALRDRIKHHEVNP